MKGNLDPRVLENYLGSLYSHCKFDFKSNGSSHLKVNNLKRLSGGTNDLYFFSSNFGESECECNSSFVLKGYLDNDTIWHMNEMSGDNQCSAREFEILQKLNQINFPVPKVYIYERNPVHLGYPFIVMEKLNVLADSYDRPDLIASVLRQIHTLNLDTLQIKSVEFPKDCTGFAMLWASRFNSLLDSNKNFERISKYFRVAARWVENNAKNAKCPSFSLIHGDFHGGNVLLTKNSGLKIIDWEEMAIGDPAFDVAYAYHMFTLTGNPKKQSLLARNAERFVQEYLKHDPDIAQRLEFYKVVTSLSQALVATSWAINPLVAYRHYGYKAVREFLVLYSHLNVKKLCELSFSAKIVHYFEDCFQSISKCPC